MRKLIGTFAIICVVVTLGTGVASAAKGGTARPWQGSGFGTVDVVTGDPQPGTLIASHLGLSTTLTQFTSSTGGTAVITAANGDQVFENLTNLTLSGLVATYDVTVTGGTGRFAGATGGGVGASNLTPTADPVVFTFTSTFSGTLSY